MPGRYRIRVDGRADQRFVDWVGELIALLRLLPPGWRAEVDVERDEPPDDAED